MLRSALLTSVVMSRRYVLAMLVITVAVFLTAYSCEDRSDPGEDIAKCREASWYASYSQDPDEIDKAMDYFSKNCYWRTDGQPGSLNDVSTQPVTPASTATPLVPTPTFDVSVLTGPTRTPRPIPTRPARPTPTFDVSILSNPDATPWPTSTPKPPTPTPIPSPTPHPDMPVGTGGYYPNPWSKYYSKLSWVPVWSPAETVGERQLERFRLQCELVGVADRVARKDGDIRYYSSAGGNYLLDHDGGATVGTISIVGSKWLPKQRWHGVPLEGEGAYSEGGTCLLVSTHSPHSTWWATDWEPEYTITIRLVPHGDTPQPAEELIFTEGYHFLAAPDDVSLRYEVQMWWTGSPQVPQEERFGKVRVFNFWSAGPGRQEKE